MSDSIFARTHANETARRNKVRELIAEYDTTIYEPTRKALVAECAATGHTPNGRWHFTVGGVAYQHCGSCHTTLYEEEVK